MQLHSAGNDRGCSCRQSCFTSYCVLFCFPVSKYNQETVAALASHMGIQSYGMYSLLAEHIYTISAALKSREYCMNQKNKFENHM